MSKIGCDTLFELCSRLGAFRENNLRLEGIVAHFIAELLYLRANRLDTFFSTAGPCPAFLERHSNEILIYSFWVCASLVR